jgi:hypothetical protein
MDKINQYLKRRTLIIGDVNSGKTDRTFKILQLFLKEGYAKKIAILDLAPGSIRGFGGKIEPPLDEPLIYLTTSISAPRLTGRNENHIRQLAENNAKAIKKLFTKFHRQKREILFVNDATLYLQAGHFKRFVEILDTASTQIINAYYGNTFADSELTRREKKLTEDLMKTCDQVITMPCHNS